MPEVRLVGEREERDGAVSVREHGGGDVGALPVADFAERLGGELYSSPLNPRQSSQSHA